MKHPNATSRKKRDRRAYAEELASARAKRSATEQLQLLDQRLGKDKGARKERLRLLKSL